MKVGGLADVAGALPKALMDLPASVTGSYQLDVRLCIPFYSQIDLNSYEFVTDVEVRKGNKRVKVVCYKTHVGRIIVYLLRSKQISKQKTVYSADVQKDGDNFILFSLAALELLKHLDWPPEILHANDWHTAIAIHKLARLKDLDPFYSHTRSVLTIHNLPFMGAGVENLLQEYGLPASNEKRLPEWARAVPLPMGLAAADKIVAVSKTYAKELGSENKSCGLSSFFKSKNTSLTGIVNGIDTDIWDPLNDYLITQKYDVCSLSKKNINKVSIIEEYGLDPDPTAPLLVYIGRMDRQKGVDLIPAALSALTTHLWNSIILGSGDPELEAFCRELEIDHPLKIKFLNVFDSALSHRLYAAGDILLMPSRYEPCGLSQLIAMRYGCIPVAADTGGLHDTILHVKGKSAGTGFLFSPTSAPAFTSAINTALKIYQSPKIWRNIQLKAMCTDYSWKRSAQSYFSIYRALVEKGLS